MTALADSVLGIAIVDDSLSTTSGSFEAMSHTANVILPNGVDKDFAR